MQEMFYYIMPIIAITGAYYTYSNFKLQLKWFKLDKEVPGTRNTTKKEPSLVNVTKKESEELGNFVPSKESTGGM